MKHRDTIKKHLNLAKLSGLDRIPVAPPSHASEGSSDSNDSLLQVKETVHSCTRCPISSHIQNYVFGEGSPHADCMFVGEAPGQEEDIQGRPFVGKAGKLLTDIITKGMKLTREQVYIANILKCRPPGNRNPHPDEISNCIEYLHFQIDTIKPKVIIALGTFAAQTLLETSTAISKLRGSFHDFRGIQLMPTFHPAYLLRNSSGKVKVWEDIKKAMSLLGIPVK